MDGSRLWFAVVGGLLAASTGCSMCAHTPEDYAYAAYGGIIQRADRLHGRVGSAFSPAEGVPAHEGEVITPGEPYHGPVLMPPEHTAAVGAKAPTGTRTASAEGSKAFDPGDILASDPQ